MTLTKFSSCFSIAAVAAALALASASSAEARPAGSSFTGKYSWGSLPITITNSGKIGGSFSDKNYKRSISGQVNADGSYSFTLEESYFEPGPRDHGWHKSTYVYSGVMSFDVDGNIVGTTNFGGSFVWLIQ